MGIVFTSEEMGTCSMTGGMSNFQKKCVASIEKRQLDPAVKDALIGNLFLIELIKFLSVLLLSILNI